ncbi:response regulator transcription factor [Microbacterium sp. NPDC090003]|uniref:helix-turn-helix transcriptional regulator n=1 Tax=Microbacterium sp. NPDC090003 TaxID=3364203 RepID=UPI0037F97BE0
MSTQSLDDERLQPPLDEVERGLRRAIGEQDWSSAVQLLGTHWSLLMDEHRDLLDLALKVVPLGAFEHDARAAAVRDIRLHSSADAVDRMLGAASLPDADDTAKLESLARSERALSLLSVASSRMIALRVRGRMSRAIQLARLVEMFGRIAAVHQPALVHDRLPAALLQAGITRGLADDLSGATVGLRDAYERAHQSRAAYVERDAAGKSALFHALEGDIEQARSWLTRHDDAPPARGWYRSPIALTAEVARSIIAVESLRPSDARAALRLLEQPVNAEQSWGPTVSYARLRYALAWGDRLGALESLRSDRVRYADWLDEGSTMGPLLAQGEVDLLLSLGQTRQARVVLDAQDDHPTSRVARAQLALVEGDVIGAARRAAAALGEKQTIRARVSALTVHALASDRRSREASASESYSDLRAAISERGLLFAALAVPADVRGTLDALLPSDHGARQALREPADRVRLTPQQQHVLLGLERGLTVREIALESHLSTNTVKSHARALYRRLESTTRDEVVGRAYELGLL